MNNNTYTLERKTFEMYIEHGLKPSHILTVVGDCCSVAGRVIIKLMYPTMKDNIKTL